MFTKTVGLGDDRVFVNIKNVEATSITTGQAVAMRIGTNASFDGTQAVRAVSSNAGDLPGWIGIAAKDIASNAYGLVQTYGPCASVLLSGQSTSITINVGDPLVPGALAGGLTSLAPSYAASGFGYVLASALPTNTISVTGTTTYVSGFIRCLK